MQDAYSQPPSQHRDGASQSERLHAALDPAYVSVDERSAKDLLGFSRAFASQLKYVDSDNREAGDWSDFIGNDQDLDQVVAFMEDPEKFDPQQHGHLFRPHFALFLAFLKLLGQARQQMNTLTQRHLDFYFQQVLRMTRKRAIADQVNVLFELAPNVDQVLVPKGRLLSAGQDSLGQDRFYRTGRDLVVNRARIARLSSLYVHSRRTGIREARELNEGTSEEGFMGMIRIALGDPLPGDPLPDPLRPRPPADTVPPLPALDAPRGKEPEVNVDYLRQLDELVKFAGRDLRMEFFELRELMRLKQQRDSSAEDWNTINQLLQKAGKNRDPKFVLPPPAAKDFDPQDFDANLALAMGGPPNYDGLTLVTNIDELYHQRARQEVRDFISDQLHFDEFDKSRSQPAPDFVRMMQIKVKIDNEWQAIDRILEQAGRKRDPSFRLDDHQLKRTDFVGKLAAAAGPVSYPAGVSGIDQYYEVILGIEEYLFMSAEEFSLVMAVAAAYLNPASERSGPTPGDWKKVDGILAGAHKKKVYADRRWRLHDERKSVGFDGMIHFALGEDRAQADDEPLERLKEFVGKDDDFAFLKWVRQMKAAEVSDDDWKRVYVVVEIAQRIRQRLPEPVACKQQWLNLHPEEVAPHAAVTLGVEADQGFSRWRTFGHVRQAADKASPPPPVFGWAISSPLLKLSQGTRTVTLTLGFQADESIAAKLTADVIRSAFQAEVSSEKGWIGTAEVEIKRGDYQELCGEREMKSTFAIQLKLSFGEDVDPIASLADSEGGIADWPVLRLMLRQTWNEQEEQFVVRYEPFRQLVLMRADLKVDVVGLASLQLQNDETLLDAKKPFEPFGGRPSAGSRFFLGHPELVHKRLDSLNFHVDWMGVPNNLTNHYANYVDAKPATEDTDKKLIAGTFTAAISLVDRRVEHSLVRAAALFAAPEKAADSHVIPIANVPLAAQQGSAYQYESMAEFELDESVMAWPRDLQWELNPPDFQHDRYPAVAAAKAVAMAAEIANKNTVDAKNYTVNPPYTPKIKSLSVDYTASLQIDFENDKARSTRDLIYHIHPFGYHEVQPGSSRGCPFLPEYDNEGELYIGIEDLRPPQTLAVLFQMAEGSADPDLEPVPVTWSGLTGNRWVSLHDGNLLLDTTRGLINSGIIEFKLDTVQPSTRLPGGLYWIRAAIAHNSNSVCDTVDIHAQAVSAVLVDDNTADDHFSQPLPPGTVTELAEPLSEIAEVRQLYTSFGGKAREQERLFYGRVSERLRHKDRALTNWDYERLILERFRQIYKAKCLPADASEDPDDLGRVTIVVIPDIRNQLPFNPFEPKAPADLIAYIENWLADKTPAFAKVEVRNAHYVPVMVRVGVRFGRDMDEGFYKQRLNEELNRFLSPWAYEEGADIIIGSRIYANSIVNFIDQRPYVDYVAEIRLFSSEDGKSFTLARRDGAEGYFVTTKRPDGVLVAVRQHVIDVISEAGYEEVSFEGINYMKVELDFVVSESV